MINSCDDHYNPEEYEIRYQKSSREKYLRNHWYPLISSAICYYCKNKIVLDLGCGTGDYITIIKKHTKQVVGFDISKNMLNFCMNKNPELSLVLADVKKVPVKSEVVDTIVCIGLFEYINHATLVKEVKRLLKPNGICIIQCANKYSAYRIYGKISCRIYGKEYGLREPSYKDLIRLFDAHHFKIIENKMNDGLIWLPDFLDKRIGESLYILIKRFIGLFRRNPFSNCMFFVIKRE